ncbi:MAG: hypothetical protein B7C24_10080 [Bacteroidetes bacterium 4572_77]|nr:MAG: hypothetical protein B7C24_10080 [Bacteroidetes bacterium 4572_77]
MDNVEIKSIDDVTQIKVKPFGMLVRFDKDKLQIRFEGSKDNTISLGGNTTFLFDGDTHFIAKGELGFITEDHDIHLDSLNSNIHLNSRLSKPIKNLPESIKERQKFEDNRLPMVENILGNEIEELKRRIMYLEEHIGV